MEWRLYGWLMLGFAHEGSAKVDVTLKLKDGAVEYGARHTQEAMTRRQASSLAPPDESPRKQAALKALAGACLRAHRLRGHALNNACTRHLLHRVSQCLLLAAPGCSWLVLAA